MAITVHIETYQTDGELNEYGDEKGSIEVTFGGKRQRIEARRILTGSLIDNIYLLGFVGRYRTSQKPWLASVWSNKDGKVSASFGRDERSGRFNKLNSISYEPSTSATLRNPKY